MRYAARLAALICCVVTNLATAAAEKRVALVIGNADYKIGRLANPVNDAEVLAEAFKAQLRFDTVIVRKDLKREGFGEALREMARASVGAELGVVFFAGHGIEIGGRNYLIPIDAALATPADIELEAIALETVLRQLDGVTKLRLVILDACRSNPFPAAKRSTTRGLGRVEPEGGTLIAYAAKDGTTADDGKAGRHSPFTAALLKRIVAPGLDVRRVFGYVSEDVMAATGRRQEPYLYGRLGGDEVYLNPQVPAVPTPVPLSAADHMWALLKDTTNIPALEAFRQQYGKENPIYDRLAEGRVEELKRRQAAVIIAPPLEEGLQQFSREKEASFSLLQGTEVVGRLRTFSGATTDLDGCASRCLAEGFCKAFSFNKETRLCYLIDHVVSRASNPSFVSAIRHSPALSPQASAFQRLQTKFSLLQDTEVVGRLRIFSGATTDLDGCASRCLAEGFCKAFSFNKETRLCYLIDHVVSRASNPSFVSATRTDSR
jgi:hypothetical protein